MFTGTLKYRDIMYKNHKQPRDVLDRDIMTKNQCILVDIMTYIYVMNQGTY
jgi:hypothetical protein